MYRSWHNGAPAKRKEKSKNTRKKEEDKTILLQEIANQKQEIGRLGLFCYISGRSPDKSGDLAALKSPDTYNVCRVTETLCTHLIRILVGWGRGKGELNI